jgi:gluconokinase
MEKREGWRSAKDRRSTEDGRSAMSGELFMGVDIGTSGVRAAVFDINGRQLALHYKEYPMICSEQGMGEVEPDRIFDSFLEVVRKCVETGLDIQKKLVSIGLSTQLFSFIALGKDGECLTNVVTWADTRSKNQAEATGKQFDAYDLYARTGCRPDHPMYPLSKILWLKNEKKGIFNKAARFITIKGYILYKLFGVLAIDITDASTMGYFNIHHFKWDEYILDKVIEIDGDMLPQPVDCVHVFRGMNREYAEIMDIRPDMPVVAGSGDGMLANVGVGVFDNTAMSCTIGTSGALRIAVKKPLLDPAQSTWCYCFTRDTWVAGGAINNGGIVLKWLRDSFRNQFEADVDSYRTDGIYKLFDNFAEEIPVGCEGLVFLPYLTGERSPNWNTNAVGTLHGLKLFHTRKHIVRAAMEAVMYRMYSVYEAVTRVSDNVRQIRANGGYVKSDIWLRMQAGIFNKEIAVTGVAEAAAFGAAYMSMYASGAIDNLNTELPCMSPVKVYRPNGQDAEKYAEMYGKFKQLYERLY